MADVEGGHVLGMIRRSFRLKSDRGPYASQRVGHTTIVVAVVGLSEVGHLQHAGVNVAAALVNSRVYFVVTVAARQQRSQVIVVAPLELGPRVGLYATNHFGRFVQIAGHLVELVQRDGFVCEKKKKNEKVEMKNQQRNENAGKVSETGRGKIN